MLPKSLQQLSNSELTQSLQNLCAEDRKTLVQLCRHLAEMDRRKYYLDLGYSSLFAFCQGELAMSEAATYRRITAARLMDRFPFLSESLENGALNLCLMGLLAPVLNEENKEELLSLVCNKTKLEASKALSNWSLAAQKSSLENKVGVGENRESQSLLPESKLRFIKPKLEAPPSVASTLSRTRDSNSPTNEVTQKVSPGYFEIKIAADAELMSLIQAAQEKLSNKNPQSTPLAEVIKKALQQFVENKTQTKNKKNPQAQKTPKETSKKNKAAAEKPQSRYIPKSIVQIVNQRAAGKCEFVSPINKKRCNSKWDLELHHQQPFVRGGSHEVQNIKKFCRQHNFHAAVQDFGHEKMSAYGRRVT